MSGRTRQTAWLANHPVKTQARFPECRRVAKAMAGLSRFARRLARGARKQRCALQGCGRQASARRCCGKALCTHCCAHTLRASLDRRLVSRCPFCRRAARPRAAALRRMMATACPSHALVWRPREPRHANPETSPGSTAVRMLDFALLRPKAHDSSLSRSLPRQLPDWLVDFRVEEFALV